MFRIIIFAFMFLVSIPSPAFAELPMYTDATVKPLSRYSSEWDKDERKNFWKRQPIGEDFVEVYTFCLNGFLFVSTAHSSGVSSSVTQVFESNSYPARCQ